MAFGFATFVTFLVPFLIYIVTASNCKSPFRWLYTSFKPQVLLVKPKMFDGFCWWNPTNPWVFCHFSSFPGGLAASLRGVQGGGSAQDLLRAVGLLGHLLGREGWRWGTFIPGAGEVIVAKPCISVDLLWDIWYTQPCDIFRFVRKYGVFSCPYFDIHIKSYWYSWENCLKDMIWRSNMIKHIIKPGSQSHWSPKSWMIFIGRFLHLNSSWGHWYPNWKTHSQISGRFPVDS